MSTPMQRTTSDGHPLHYSSGALICEDGKYLLIDRAIPPYGFACVAGHIDEGETAEEALVRETKEEVGLTITHRELLLEEALDWNWCSQGVYHHYWHVFQCSATGTIDRNAPEAHSVGWYTPEETKELTLEPVWKYWLEKLGVI